MALSWLNTQSGAAGFIDNVTPTVLLTNAQGAGKAIVGMKLLIVNVDTTTARTLEFYHIPSGGAVSGDDYKIIKGRNINPSDGTFGTEDIRELVGEVLNNGDSWRALAGTASKLKYTLSYGSES